MLPRNDKYTEVDRKFLFWLFSIMDKKYHLHLLLFGIFITKTQDQGEFTCYRIDLNL